MHTQLIDLNNHAKLSSLSVSLVILIHFRESVCSERFCNSSGSLFVNIYINRMNNLIHYISIVEFILVNRFVQTVHANQPFTVHEPPKLTKWLKWIRMNQFTEMNHYMFWQFMWIKPFTFCELFTWTIWMKRFSKLNPTIIIHS